MSPILKSLIPYVNSIFKGEEEYITSEENGVEYLHVVQEGSEMEVGEELKKLAHRMFQNLDLGYSEYHIISIVDGLCYAFVKENKDKIFDLTIECAFTSGYWLVKKGSEGVFLGSVRFEEEEIDLSSFTFNYRGKEYNLAYVINSLSEEDFKYFQNNINEYIGEQNKDKYGLNHITADYVSAYMNLSGQFEYWVTVEEIETFFTDWMTKKIEEKYLNT